jgi:diguanylate cyclase (GGDEF)-like protein
VGERALTGARELEAADLECNAQLNLGALDLSRGRLLEAEERFLAAQQLAERAGGRAMAAEARLRRAEIATLREQPDAAALAAEAEDEAAALGMGVEAALAAALRAVGRARAQAPLDEVDACARRALDPLQASGAAGDLAQARLWVAEAMLAAQEHQRARALLDKVRVYAREQSDVQLALRADALDARISAHWSDPDRDARLEKMISLAVAINEATALDATLNQIARAGLDLVGGERAFVLLGQPPELMASALTEGASGGPSTSVVAQAMRDRKEVIAADVDERADLRARQSVVSLELRSVLCVPLLHRDEALGALYVDSRTASQRHLWNCALVMRGLAALAAVAVVRARMHQESVRQAQESARQAERLRAAAELHEKNAALQQLNEQLRLAAITDTLTGLYNRRHLAEVLAPLHWEATGRGERYGVLLLDIDHFKRVNDTWGHPAGDLVIQNVAGIVLATVREEDLAFRYGGEELLVVLRGATMEALLALGERLRGAVRAQPFEVCPGERHPVTVSVGAAVVHPGGDLDWDSVLQRADNALYAAKRGGRDRVVGHAFDELAAAAG